ncbi:MAG TPA: hydroxymethylglutaryl-CoA reductase [Planctomycetota bacterium]|nr:hydroxymethylglutaryl-CoA reductase [Planctomycetota bacterium]
MHQPTSPEPRLPRIPRDRSDDYDPKIVARRRALCEGAAGRDLLHMAGKPLAPAEARGNVENLIGFMQIPLGIAGPLCVHTSSGWREVYVPMATSEGAMVASYSRGMRLLKDAGGARARVLTEGLSQHPMLLYADGATAQRGGEWARHQYAELAEIVVGLSQHGRLRQIVPQVIGRRLILRLVFETGDAIGINMASLAADRIARRVMEQTSAEQYFVHGQDVEKRANARAQVEGRGRYTLAEITIPRDVLEGVMRVTPEQMVDIHRSYCVGFAQLGTQNWAVQIANGLAAVFLACGQDVAYLTESATGWLDLEVDTRGNLYAALTLPSLIVGTVGGGTGLSSASECLDILGCRGAGKVQIFAELLAATALAGDLSLMAAFCAHEFVAAHEALGRNRPGGQA